MTCKICDSVNLKIFAHTAKCQQCGVLLYYPYPQQSELDGAHMSREAWLEWHVRSSYYNHKNFTTMINFTIDRSLAQQAVKVLDYGGGGGQFALVCRSIFPLSEIYITDHNDDALLDQYRYLNNQIKFKDFAMENNKFDYIFLNDVFEHVANPKEVLKLLSNKISDNGKIFIDTPKQFWLYPILKQVNTNLYKKLLIGTVSTAHLQIWSRKSFRKIISEAGLTIIKYSEISEYTMPPEFYLDNMGIRNFILRALGKIFYRFARYLANNKIQCVLTKTTQ
jgi:2-polyprenyl-3-methyl-5-hydroxy-6-metoxy-1,4-benzoquinol methylase